MLAVIDSFINRAMQLYAQSNLKLRFEYYLLTRHTSKIAQSIEHEIQNAWLNFQFSNMRMVDISEARRLKSENGHPKPCIQKCLVLLKLPCPYSS